MITTKPESAEKILASVLDQLDSLMPRRSYIIGRLYKEIPSIQGSVPERELLDAERRALIGKPEGADPATVYQDVLRELRTESDDPELIDELPEYVIFDIVPTPVANAQIVQLGELSWRIEVNVGMWSLLSAFARILALSSSPQEAETDPVTLTPAVRQQILADLVKLEIQAPELLAEVASRALPDNDQEQFAVTAANNAKRFVVAHELQHLFLGHIFSGAAVDRQLRVIVSSQAVPAQDDEISMRWDDEFSADTGAFDVLLKLAVTGAERRYKGKPEFEDMRRGAAIRTYLGVITAIGTLLILEGGSETTRSPSHPPADARLRNIRTHIEARHPGASEALFRMSDAMEEFYRDMSRSLSQA